MKVRAKNTIDKIIAGETYQVVVNYHDTYELLIGGKYSADLFDVLPEKGETISVSPRQMRTALLFNGITSTAIDEMIANIPDPMQREAIAIAWEYSLSFDKDNEYLKSMAEMMKMSQEQIDVLFDYASTL
jgi:hypothetical protein